MCVCVCGWVGGWVERERERKKDSLGYKDIQLKINRDRERLIEKQGERDREEAWDLIENNGLRLQR